MNSATQTLASFLTIMNECIGGNGDDSDGLGTSTLDASVSKIGVAIDIMQTKIADIQDASDQLKQELEEM